MFGLGARSAALLNSTILSSGGVPAPLPTISGTLVSFGDSVMAGTGATVAGNSWVKRLMLAQGVTLTNMAVSGWGLEDEFTQSGKITNAYLTTNALGANKKDNVLIVAGGNDVFTSDTNLNVTAANYAKSLRQRIAVLRLGGYAPSDIIIGSLYPVPDAGLASQGVTRATWEAFNATIAPIVAEHGVRFFNLYSINGGAPEPGLTTGDNIHPNDAGHQQIADVAMTVLSTINAKARPTDLVVTSPLDGVVRVAFTEVAGALSYEAQVEVGGNFIYVGSGTSATSPVSVSGLTTANHRARVRAIFVDGPGPWEFSTTSVAVTESAVPIPDLLPLGLAANTVVENTAAGAVIGGLTNTTAEATLSMFNSDGSRFAISGTNVVTGSVATNFEAATSHNIVVRQTRTGAANSPLDTPFTITVTNVNEQPNLGVLSLSATEFQSGVASSGTIIGATASSVITSSGLPTGFTINSAARTWTWSGAGSVSTGTLNLIETLGDSANSPRTTPIGYTVTAAPVVPTIPPADWRMPATVTTSSGLSAYQSALAAAQASAASKSRPSVVVAAGTTEHIDLAVGASDTGLILTWVGSDVGTVEPSVNGSPETYSPQFPEGSDIYGSALGRRQKIDLPAGGARTIRATITAGAGPATVYLLLFKKPASGPMDSHIVFGASREAQNLGCRDLETAVIASYPTRDPIVFNWARSSQNAAWCASVAPAAATLYGSTASYALLGSIAGNDENSNHPYTSGQKASLDASFASLCGALSGFKIAFGNLSYRLRGTLPDQTLGSAPYNDAVVHPAIALYAPDYFDNVYQRALVDEYLGVLKARGDLTDDRHGAPTMTRALWVATHFARVYSGTWTGITPQAEKRVQEAEAAATNKASAQTAYTEATYSQAALISSSGKSALQARLDAILPTVKFYEAVRLIDIAVASNTSGDKSVAQTALDAASAAGYSGGTAPNTIAAQQTRINNIIIASFDQVIPVGFGSNTAVTGWNRYAAVALGVLTSSMNDSTGALTGVGINVTNAPSGVNTQTGLVSAVPDIPNAILTATWSDTANQIGFTVTGLTPGRVYDILFMSSRVSATPSASRITVNGAVIGDMQNDNNVSETVLASAVTSDDSGNLTVVASKGTVDNTGATSSFTYLTAMIIKRRSV